VHLEGTGLAIDSTEEFMHWMDSTGMHVVGERLILWNVPVASTFAVLRSVAGIVRVMSKSACGCG